MGGMSGETVLLMVHAGSTAFMAGLIWFVQVVHYPMFVGVGEESWRAYSAEHQRRTTWVVGPVMMVELVTTAAVALGLAGSVAGWMGWLGAGMLAGVWASTFLVQVPMHERLGRGREVAVMRRLVATNWVRTVLWSARAVLALWMLGLA